MATGRRSRNERHRGRKPSCSDSIKDFRGRDDPQILLPPWSPGRCVFGQNVTVTRGDYRAFRTIATRWMDNDAYGHINNTVYYSWFDTAVNALLVEYGLLDISAGPLIGLVVETGCRYARSIAFPEPVEAGVRIAHLGTSSIRWEVAIFTTANESAAATGFFVHVYVDRGSRRPVPLPAEWRNALAPLVVPQVLPRVLP